jgi:hypothetical protein
MGKFLRAVKKQMKVRRKQMRVHRLALIGWEQEVDEVEAWEIEAEKSYWVWVGLTDTNAREARAAWMLRESLWGDDTDTDTSIHLWGDDTDTDTGAHEDSS